MGSTYSSCSCCWSDHRTSDVIESDNGTLNDKLLVNDDYHDYHGEHEITRLTVHEDSDGNPYSRFEEFRKQNSFWPRPATTPVSAYTHGGVSEMSDSNDDDHDHEDSDSEGDRHDSQNSTSSHSDPGHAWDLKPRRRDDEGEVKGDNKEQDKASSFLRLNRGSSAAQSARSSVSDSYASLRDLQVYGSQLFTGDEAARKASAGGRTSDGSNAANDFMDDDDTTRSSDLVPSSSPFSFLRVTAHNGSSNSSSDAHNRKKSH
uniref:Uncharacterized protein n=1 Tax=Globisporangium ultimum (strain ATCC 200006 / CBS 805.95 / DAOM BR144) TaxID=431595 RepID=K3X3Q0_GLOUD